MDNINATNTTSTPDLKEQSMQRFSHVFSIAFSVESNDRFGEDVTPQMLRVALLKRIADLDQNDEWGEATGVPHDTYEIQG